MNKNEQRSSKAQRGGDTGRSSSQGRKLSSGGPVNKKGIRKINDQAKSSKTAVNKTK